MLWKHVFHVQASMLLSPGTDQLARMLFAYISKLYLQNVCHAMKQPSSSCFSMHNRFIYLDNALQWIITNALELVSSECNAFIAHKLWAMQPLSCTKEHDSFLHQEVLRSPRYTQNNMQKHKNNPLAQIHFYVQRNALKRRSSCRGECDFITRNRTAWQNVICIHFKSLLFICNETT